MGRVWSRLTHCCVLCGSRGAISVGDHGVYALTKKLWYHPACIAVVLDHPEEHRDKVDMALNLVELIKEEKRRQEEWKGVMIRRIKEAQKVMNTFGHAINTLEE